jgi:serine/threonine-protein phosphatase 2B catalytic subunit
MMTNRTVTQAEIRQQVIKNKIKAVGKLAIVFNTLRNENESIMELKSVLGVQKLPPGSLALGAEGIKEGMNCQESSSFLTMIL